MPPHAGPATANPIRPAGRCPLVHRLGPLLEDADRALVVGLGGGGDVVGTIPTKHLLEAHGVEAVLGGAAWQRKPHDPHPGPRPIAHFDHVEVLDPPDADVPPTAALAGPRTRTRDGHPYPEAVVADLLGGPTVLVDITRGPDGVASGLRAALDRLDADLVVGVDVGGDLLADGTELGLRSPLCDSVMAAGIAALDGGPDRDDADGDGDPQEGDRRAVLASFGLCADGELTLDEVLAHLTSLRKAGGYLGSWPLPRPAAEEMDRCLREVPSEASRIPLLAFRGERGDVPIRHGTTHAVAHAGSTLTHFLDPGPFLAWSPMQRAIAGAADLVAANEALHDLGVERTELDIEEWMEARGATRYTDVPRGGDDGGETG